MVFDTDEIGFFFNFELTNCHGAVKRKQSLIVNQRSKLDKLEYYLVVVLKAWARGMDLGSQACSVNSLALNGCVCRCNRLACRCPLSGPNIKQFEFFILGILKLLAIITDGVILIISANDVVCCGCWWCKSSVLFSDG